VAAVEFLFTLVPLILLVIFFKRMRLSYWIFSVSALVLPTLTGTFSSMPRYALTYALFLIPYMVVWVGKYYRMVVVLSLVLGCILLGLFIRGYWIS
jgi:hypothetical protein